MAAVDLACIIICNVIREWFRIKINEWAMPSPKEGSRDRMTAFPVEDVSAERPQCWREMPIRTVKNLTSQQFE
jgi:hypothetical protein